MGTVNDTPWGEDAKNSKKKGTGSEITDGEDG
jgi:hypothetical protein